MKIIKFKAVCVAAAVASAGINGSEPIASTSTSSKGTIILPEPIPDPLERVNRGLWAVNEAAMKHLMKPTAKVYRLLVPPPFRIGISNVGKNLGYPRRVVNNILQERWTGARDESYRFLCNSVLGFGGFLNVADEFKIPVSEADFGQTFGRWGWNQNFYIMLPISGPSSDRDAVGSMADSAVNPLTYFSPYNYIPTGIVYNNLTDTIDTYVRRSESEMDPYSLLRYAHALIRKERPVDWTAQGDPHIPSLETMQTVRFGIRDPRFPERGRTRKARVASTGRDLPYTVWMQPAAAPIIYILPGIGAHRLNGGALALSELLYERGFSVASISSAFNFEFIANGLTAPLPGYSLSDVKDIHLALTEIDRRLQLDYPRRIAARGLMGYSLGGFHTLLIAAHAQQHPQQLQFDRYLSIDAPVRLLHGIATLDSFYNAALDWPEAERTDRIEQLFVKIAALVKGVVPAESVRLSATESKFLVGLAFRMTLRDIIYFTQLRHDQGVLKQPLDKWKREPSYREIMQYSFTDYLEQFIGPYYKTRDIDILDEETLRPAVDLRLFADRFRSQKNINLIANENDILLEPQDVTWMAETFGERVTLFPQGGHLGNLGDTTVQTAILKTFLPLQEPVRRDIISRGVALR